MPADVPFKFTLRQSGGNYRPLVFGSSYSTMVVGEIYQEGREFLAIRYWSGGRHESFASLVEGLPDDWTRYGIDEKGREIEMSDAARYHMTGNGVVSPIAEHLALNIRGVLA